MVRVSLHNVKIPDSKNVKICYQSIINQIYIYKSTSRNVGDHFNHHKARNEPEIT